MTDASILGRVQHLVLQTAGPGRTPEDAGPDTPLAEGGFRLDSVDLIEVVVACEHEFGVIFAGTEDLTPMALTSARTLAALIGAKGGC